MNKFIFATACALPLAFGTMTYAQTPASPATPDTKTSVKSPVSDAQKDKHDSKKQSDVKTNDSTSDQPGTKTTNKTNTVNPQLGHPVEDGATSKSSESSVGRTTDEDTGKNQSSSGDSTQANKPKKY